MTLQFFGLSFFGGAGSVGCLHTIHVIVTCYKLYMIAEGRLDLLQKIKSYLYTVPESVLLALQYKYVPKAWEAAVFADKVRVCQQVFC